MNGSGQTQEVMMMTNLRARKVKICKSNNIWWILFPEGHIDKPLCVISDSEMEVLVADINKEDES